MKERAEGGREAGRRLSNFTFPLIKHYKTCVALFPLRPDDGEAKANGDARGGH